MGRGQWGRWLGGGSGSTRRARACAIRRQQWIKDVRGSGRVAVRVPPQHTARHDELVRLVRRVLVLVDLLDRQPVQRRRSEQLQPENTRAIRRRSLGTAPRTRDDGMDDERALGRDVLDHAAPRLALRQRHVDRLAHAEDGVGWRRRRRELFPRRGRRRSWHRRRVRRHGPWR